MNFLDDVYLFIPKGCLQWTKLAVQCYHLKGNCTKCEIANGDYETINHLNCRMKYIVKELLKKRRQKCSNGLQIE